MGLKVYFYKAIHAGIPGLYSRAVRLWTKSQYSHCELVFSDGVSASSSFMDKGVRFKQIEFDADKWDVVDIPISLETKARKWFEDHQGQPYDLLGNLHFVISPIADDKSKWFCSEAVANALGIDMGWRFDPGTLYYALKLLSDVNSQK